MKGRQQCISRSLAEDYIEENGFNFSVSYFEKDLYALQIPVTPLMEKIIRY
jgi:hypothetical protein